MGSASTPRLMAFGTPLITAPVITGREALLKDHAKRAI